MAGDVGADGTRSYAAVDLISTDYEAEKELMQCTYSCAHVYGR